MPCSSKVRLKRVDSSGEDDTFSITTFSILTGAEFHRYTISHCTDGSITVIALSQNPKSCRVSQSATVGA